MKLLHLLIRTVYYLSIAGALGLIVTAAAVRDLGGDRLKLLLTLIGCFSAAAVARITLWASPGAPAWMTRGGLMAILPPFVAFLANVWTSATEQPTLWRAWWMSMVLSVSWTHLLAIRRGMRAGADRLGRATLLATALAGFLLFCLGFSPRLPAKPGLAFFIFYALAAAVSAIGCWALWYRYRRQPGPRPPLSRGIRNSLLAASHAALFAAGIYLGAGPVPPDPAQALPFALQGLTADQLDRQIRADLERLKAAVAGLQDLNRRAGILRDELAKRRKAEGREFYRPEEDDRIRAHFLTYLSYRSSLLRLVATYAGYQTVADPGTRTRCFILGYGAGVAAYDAALTLVTMYGVDPIGQKKLNEAESRWGIPAGMYDQIYYGAAKEENLQQIQEGGAYYLQMCDTWKTEQIFPAGDFLWLDERIRTSLAYVRSHEVSRTRAWVSRLVDRVTQDVRKPVYSAQSILSTWIGDTKVIQEQPLISLGQIRELRRKLKPGDILLERRNWYLSNAFLPGFWPHGALYVGDAEDIRKLEIADRPEVRRRFPDFCKMAADGNPHTVIESVSDGVIFNSLEESMHADYVAVLRPRLLDPRAIAEAVATAFSHQGKPYDFEFDFFTSDKLVCTELVYRSYEGALQFDLERVMGRDTLPADQIVRKFIRERARPGAQLEFVLFLDGRPGEKRADYGDVETFCVTPDRPSAFNK